MDSFPRASARTRRFTLGEPRTLTVCRDGRVLFLRAASGTDPATALWRLDPDEGREHLVVGPDGGGAEQLSDAEQARRERVRETAAGVVAYSATPDGSTVVVTLGGELVAVDVDSGQRTVLPARDPFDPRIDPTGRAVAYVKGDDLRLVNRDGGDDRLLVGSDGDHVAWGRAEHVAAEEMDRTAGFWWAPDGESLLVARVDESAVPTVWVPDLAHPSRAPRPMRYPLAGAANAEVSLHRVDLDGARTEVGWDRGAFPYLARVVWTQAGAPLLQVQSRDQRTVQTLGVEPRSGATWVLHEDSDPVWVELATGVPGWHRGSVVRVGDRDGQRRLLVGDDAVTDDDTYVRSVVAVDDERVVLTASVGEPSQVHVLAWSPESGVEWLTHEHGVHSAAAAGGVLVLSKSALDHDGTRVTVLRDGAQVASIASYAEVPPLSPQVRRLRLGPRELRAGLLLPRGHRRGTRLPVLLDPYGGPHAQRVMASRRMWLEPQWWADQGFAVLVADGRGTPGRNSGWDRALHRELAEVTLADQVDALAAAAEAEPDLDLTRVAIRGWSYGGYLAALAVLRRPDVFHAAVAGAPVTDWTLYDTHYTERYLGDPGADPQTYERNSVLADAAALSRPLLVIHGLADDNVLAAHSVRLSQRLTEHGRPHTLLPLAGITHMTPQETVAENLLLLQRDFLRAALRVEAG